MIPVPRLVSWLYMIANASILLGFLLMAQPVSHALFMLGFPVILAGIILYLILDHLPARFHRAGEDNDSGGVP